MNEPLFLTLDEVLQLHAYQTEHFGGDPAVLNLHLLESAIASPPNAWHYEQADLPAIAAAYLYHLVKNHPFADGNKRTGTHAAIAFLAMNNVDVDYPKDQAEQVIVAVAAGQAAQREVVEFFKKLLESG